MTFNPLTYIKKFPEFYAKHEYAFVCFFILAWQVFLICLSKPILSETDNFTHALRVVDFIRSGSWTEIMYMHDNYPFGQILHFTRAMDMVLYACSLPFLPFTDVQQAVLYGCFLYQTVIAVLSATALIWTGKASFGPFLRLLLVTFYFCQYPVLILFTAGRADHHVLLNLLQIVILGNLMHGFKTQNNAYFKAAGLFAGLAVWTTPEGFLNNMLILAGLVCCWLIKKQNMNQIRLLTQYFFLSAAYCLILNPPMQGVFFPDNGRLSILLVAILGFAFISFYMEERMENENIISSFPSRFFSITLASLFSFGFVLFLFGAQTVFAPPIPPELFDIWTKYITELLPSFGTPSALAKFNGFLLAALFLSVPTLFFAPDQYRKTIITVGIPVVFFAVMTLLSRRFGRTGSVFAALMITLCLRIWYQKVTLLHKECLQFFLIIPCGIYLLCSYLFLLCLSYDTQLSSQALITDPDEYMPYISKEKGGILTASSRGPETAWGTGIPVIGSPYHSNARGIMAAYNILYGTNPVSVQQLLKERQIKTILLDNPFYYLPKNIKKDRVVFNPHTFLGRLLQQKETFCFVRPAPDVPEKVKKRYLIYLVNFDNCQAM